MATSGRRAQEAIRAHGSNKCSKHYGKKIIYICENCDTLSCVDCASQQHKGHEVNSLLNLIPAAKQKLQDFINTAEGTEIPRINDKFKKVDDDLFKNKTHFQNQVSLIKQRNEIAKKELDKITDTFVKTCHDMEHQNLDTLLKHQKDIRAQLDKLSAKIQEVKSTLQSEDDVLVYDTSRLILLEFEDLASPSCKTAEFSPNKSPLNQLLLGQLNITNQCQSRPLLCRPVNWKVLSELIPYKRGHVESIYAAGNKAWLSDFGDTMLLVNQKGKIQQILHIDIIVTDFCLSPRTGNIWYCSDDENVNIVKEVKDSRAQVKFITDKTLWCICVTRDDHVLVGTGRQIEKYTQIGNKICTTVEGTTSVVSVPYQISECSQTRNVAVVNKDLISDGGSGKPFLSILNDQLQLLHTYKGEVSGPMLRPEAFDPCNVCYTDTGELVIIDKNSKSVILVTGRGNFLQTLLTDSESLPCAVSMHSGAMWLSFQNGKVKVLKDN